MTAEQSAQVRRPVDYESKPTVCPACLTNTALSPCPQNCPTREDAQR